MQRPDQKWSGYNHTECEWYTNFSPYITSLLAGLAELLQIEHSVRKSLESEEFDCKLLRPLLHHFCIVL